MTTVWESNQTCPENLKVVAELESGARIIAKVSYYGVWEDIITGLKYEMSVVVRWRPLTFEDSIKISKVL